ncbi:hypothetical protein PQJ75_14050 [Rhodoplanes sp. TEM]|uniref:DUF2474 domain-containing protein n=1 Tax=Rhodoplanes tepidamans TaxID=200616 RepID=A0ABT5JG59_RHOTP|nr:MULTISPECIES: hypothetical protein [Rhodoplanes]MDC7788015.1 hypothetical protein [Rhodoplanes tepidamans]MDC7984855.1 hypothetical protein [Rhodoplanes sp. TEM]MDQ0358444.1 hypothetical protein [Rhodoplanes tepidamans]
MTLHRFEQVPSTSDNRCARFWLVLIVVVALTCAWLTVSAVIHQALIRGGLVL